MIKSDGNVRVVDKESAVHNTRSTWGIGVQHITIRSPRNHNHHMFRDARRRCATNHASKSHTTTVINSGKDVSADCYIETSAPGTTALRTDGCCHNASTVASRGTAKRNMNSTTESHVNVVGTKEPIEHNTSSSWDSNDKRITDLSSRSRSNDTHGRSSTTESHVTVVGTKEPTEHNTSSSWDSNDKRITDLSSRSRSNDTHGRSSTTEPHVTIVGTKEPTEHTDNNAVRDTNRWPSIRGPDVYASFNRSLRTTSTAG
jgi:hypothetical protein